MTERNEWKRTWIHTKNLLELRRIVDQDLCRKTIVDKFLLKGRILDAGCGEAAFTFYLAALGYDIHGVDYVEKVIESNKKIAEDSKIVDPNNFKVMDICKLEYPDGFFDGYLSMGVVEHFDNPVVPLREAFRVVREGGIALITVPNKLSPWHITRSILSKTRIAHLVWQREYSPSDLAKLAKKAGFEEITRFSCNVSEAFKLAFLLNTPQILKLPNPLYLIRALIYRFAKLAEKHMSFLGYHSVFVGRKSKKQTADGTN